MSFIGKSTVSSASNTKVQNCVGADREAEMLGRARLPEVVKEDMATGEGTLIAAAQALWDPFAASHGCPNGIEANLPLPYRFQDGRVLERRARSNVSASTWREGAQMALRGLLVGALMLATPSLGDEIRVIEGQAEAINADILKIGQDRIVLWGIDAPEPDQVCSANGQKWGCFDAALRTLQGLISAGSAVCFTTGHSDPFKRHYAVCEANGLDINAQMVRAGMAMAFPEESDAYMPVQLEAIAAGVGLWQPGVDFQPPWEWREIQSPGGYK